MRASSLCMCATSRSRSPPRSMTIRRFRSGIPCAVRKRTPCESWSRMPLPSAARHVPSCRSVRDELLGVPVVDRDYVVVGASPEALIAQGYKPVGRDFPVFLHPETREEYALARTERKSGRGYHGFVFHTSPDVTLEEDLRRR